MRLSLVRKEELTSAQVNELDRRIEDCVRGHEGECGPIMAWRMYKHYLYAFVLKDTNTPIAIAEASGRPVSLPGWWIAPEYRGQGHGNELVDLLAQHLLGDGVSEIGLILIQTPNGQFDEQSRKLVSRLRNYFLRNRLAPASHGTLQQSASSVVPALTNYTLDAPSNECDDE
jgi:hypothetical protein